jgi:hypothetical protein
MPIKLMFGEAFPGDTFTHEHCRYKALGRVFSDYPAAHQYAEQSIYGSVGQIDALIYERQPKNPNERAHYRVYHTPKHYDIISPAKAKEIGYDLDPFDRKAHIHCMHTAGRKGITDMSKFSGKFVAQPVTGLSGVSGVSSLDISPDHDIIGFDHPREDILVEKTKAGKTMRTGGNTFIERSTLANAAKHILNTNFTGAEVRKMNLYFEANPIMMQGAVGTHSKYKPYGRPPLSTISVSFSGLNESVLTHEIVHALRAADGRRAVADRDSEEIATEYEATLRVQEPRKVRGYYQYVPGVLLDGASYYDMSLMEDSVLADRVLATGATDKPLKGRRLTHEVVPNTIMNSRIETARGAFNVGDIFKPPNDDAQPLIAEDVDNYFQIKLPDKSTVEYHIRFNKARPSLAKIKKHLKAKFGKNIEAWEWHDGKRVRLISRPKKPRTRKQTTTKRTPAKRKTPTRKPVAAKRYGLDAILGVPEGIL